MTRPGGPAEPPGPSAGMEIAAHFKGRGLTPEEAADLARRIDAALAEREAQLAACRVAFESLQFVDRPVEELLAKGQRVWTNCGIADLARHMLTSTADAAARCVARARQEGAEAMRERCAQLAERPRGIDMSATWQNQADSTGKRIAAAIRALDAGDPAARRG